MTGFLTVLLACGFYAIAAGMHAGIQQRFLLSNYDSYFEEKGIFIFLCALLWPFVLPFTIACLIYNWIKK